MHQINNIYSLSIESGIHKLKIATYVPTYINEKNEDIFKKWRWLDANSHIYNINSFKHVHKNYCHIINENAIHE